MQDLINKKITNAKEAKEYIDFIETQYIYHPDDCATTIVDSEGNFVYSYDQASLINKRNEEIFSHLKCPYSYILQERGKRYSKNINN